MSIKSVVFDLGAVLIDWNPRYLYRKIFEKEEEMESFLQNVCTQAWNSEQDSGRSWREAVEILQKDHPQYHYEIALYAERWTEMLGGEIPETVDILRRVKETNIPIYALTNWSREKFPVALELYDFLGWFDGILVSGEEGVKKPDRAIFELFLQRFDLESNSTFFVDDNHLNVKVASEVGFQAFLFETPERLERDFRNLGPKLSD